MFQEMKMQGTADTELRCNVDTLCGSNEWLIESYKWKTDMYKLKVLCIFLGLASHFEI